jgi:prepilin-type N-terminal cleavage/methylation domain-containing protein
MRGAGGFTLLEVAVATSLLSVGLLALVNLQAQALQVQRRVRVVRELVSVAEGELDHRLAALSPGDRPCSIDSRSPLVAACRSIAQSCSAGNPYPCGPAAGRAISVTVTVSGASGQEFVLRALGAAFPGP